MELLNDLILELEKPADANRFKLSRLWEQLFKTMASAHVKIIQTDLLDMVKAREKHLKPVLSRLTDFAYIHFIMPAYYGDLKTQFLLPEVVGNILIQYPESKGFYACGSCDYLFPRGGEKLQICPACQASLD